MSGLLKGGYNSEKMLHDAEIQHHTINPGIEVSHTKYTSLFEHDYDESLPSPSANRLKELLKMHQELKPAISSQGRAPFKGQCYLFPGEGSPSPCDTRHQNPPSSSGIKGL